jgi:hypothetical protein
MIVCRRFLLRFLLRSQAPSIERDLGLKKEFLCILPRNHISPRDKFVSKAVVLSPAAKQ